MRVTHVITRLIVGGAQENTISTVLGLAEKPGVSVDLIAGPTTGSEGSLEWKFDSRPSLLRVIPELVRPVSPWMDLRCIRSLASMFRVDRPDIVHTHSSKAGIVGRVAARIAKVPIIVHTIHGPSFGRFQGKIPNVIFIEAERMAARCTTHFTSVADAMTKQYLAAGIGTAAIYTRILSGFELTQFLAAKNDLELRRKLGIRPDDFVVGKIARLFELKGHDYVFASAQRLIERIPRIKFLFVGDGPLRELFEKMVRDKSWENHFVFTGLVAPHEVPRLVGIMDVVIHLSLREGLPRALPQALAASRPVVAFDCDGAGEVCLDGSTGFLLPVGDVDGLVRSLTVLESDEALRKRLGKAGQDMVKELFPVQKMVDDTFELYRRLMAK
jgi:glycosyltransferase involved in cell wall biosynthesis